MNYKRLRQTRFQILSSVILNHTGGTQGVPRKFRVPGVFSRDENYRRQNLIENTIWQCFEGFLTRFHEHASWAAIFMVSTFFGGRVPGGASECLAAMPSVGTSLGTLTTEICLLQNFRHNGTGNQSTLCIVMQVWCQWWGFCESDPWSCTWLQHTTMKGDPRNNGAARYTHLIYS
jgi:hypothetical protein